MKPLLLLLLLPIVAAAQPTFGPYPVPGSNGGGPTNGQTAAQVAAQITSTNDNIIVPTRTTAINTSSNLVYANAIAAINTASNLTYLNAIAAINSSSNLVYLNAIIAINVSSNSVVTNLPPRANYLAFTNSTVGLSRQVPLSQAHNDTNGSPAATWTNLFIGDLEYHAATNSFTNWIVGFLQVTNKDGLIFQIPIGTNQ